MPTTTRTYIGQTGTQAFDGWAGFRIDQEYTFEVTELENGEVDITTTHLGEERDITLTKAQFEDWFKKP